MNKFARFIPVTQSTRAAAIAGLALSAVAARADAVTDVFGAISLTGVATAVGALMVVVIGISMAFKAADLGKRAVRKV